MCEKPLIETSCTHSICFFVCFDSLGLSQQFFSHVGTVFLKVSCSKTQQKASNEAPTLNLESSTLPLSHHAPYNMLWSSNKKNLFLITHSYLKPCPSQNYHEYTKYFVNHFLFKTRPNSALDLRRGCISVCEQSMCKVQIYKNEIRIHQITQCNLQ